MPVAFGHDGGRERGGVLLRFPRGEGGEALGFVPADVARRLTTLSSLTPVPGARAPVMGIALADGAVVTVLRIPHDGEQRRDGEPRRCSPNPSGRDGAPPSRDSPRPSREGVRYEPGEDWIVPGADRALLCNVGGFDVALTGATVLATGIFDTAPDGQGVLWRSEVVPVIDVRALYAQAEAATWARRASAPASGPGVAEEDGGRR